MSTPQSTQTQTRRDKVRALAFKGKTRKEIADELDVPYQTVSLDLKTLGIIPVTPRTRKGSLTGA